MIINDIPFNVSVMDVVSELKEQLALNGVNLFSKFFDSGGDVMVCCPYHKEGQERRPSAGIRKSDGLFHCLACGKTVGLDEMIANCFGRVDPLWGYQWLTKNFLTVKVEERKGVEINLARTNHSVKNSSVDSAHNCVTEEELDGYRYTHSYVHERGLTDEIIELFDIGYDKDADAITFPVRYWGSVNNGRCMFVAKRNVQYKRFDLPKSIDKPLYGLYELWNYLETNLMTNKVNEVYICEGLFDCLRLWCNGKIAVAGFGCLFSEYQMTLLEGLPTRKIVLALDNDKAGREANKRIRQRIRDKLITEVILPKGRKDIGECTDEEIQNLQEVFS